MQDFWNDLCMAAIYVEGDMYFLLWLLIEINILLPVFLKIALKRETIMKQTESVFRLTLIRVKRHKRSQR